MSLLKKPVRLSLDYVVAARELYSGDTIRHARDLAFVETCYILGSRKATRGLKWENVNLDQGWIGTPELLLSHEALKALQSWRTKLDEFISVQNPKPFPLVFCYFQRNSQPYIVNRQMLEMSNLEPKTIFVPCQKKVDQSRLLVNEHAAEIQRKLNELEVEKARLETELRQSYASERSNANRPQLELPIHVWLQRSYQRKLANAGITTLDQLLEWLDAQPFKIEGIGKVGIASIRQSLKDGEQWAKESEYFARLWQRLEPIYAGTSVTVDKKVADKYYPYAYEWDPSGMIVSDAAPASDFVQVQINKWPMTIEVNRSDIVSWGRLTKEKRDELFPP